MLRLSKKVEYALISMLFMEERAKGELTTSRELAENFNIPQEIVGKVLQRLAKSGIVNSVQGVKGGYQLAYPPEKISLTSVIMAIDGPIRVVNCVEETEECSCEQFDFCNMRSPMETIQLKLISFFNAISLKDLKSNHFPLNPNYGQVGGGTPVDFIDHVNQ